MKKALFDVQSLMNVVQANLPATGANLKPSWVLSIDPLNLPILSLSVTGDSRWDKVQLREFVDNDVVNRLKTIPQVYSVVPFGGYKRQLQVIVDRDKLAAYKLSILDVKNAIDRYNVARSGGTLTSGANEAIVRVDTRATDPQTVLNYPVAEHLGGGAVTPAASGRSSGRRHGNGRRIVFPIAQPPTPIPDARHGHSGPAQDRLRSDVARVIDTHWERRSAYHFVDHGKIKESIEAARDPGPGGKLGAGRARGDEGPEPARAGEPRRQVRGRLRQRALRRHPLQEHVRGAGHGDPAHRHRGAAVPGRVARHADRAHHHPDLAGDGDPAADRRWG